MSIYRCPNCHHEIIQMKVYAKPPNKVMCPYCNREFDPSESRKNRATVESPEKTLENTLKKTRREEDLLGKIE